MADGRYYSGKKVDPFYLSRPWKLAREAVLMRDSYRCQVCLRRWAKTVHHKIPRLQRPDLALEPDNLEAICTVCHNQIHDEKGRAGRPAREATSGVKGIRIIKL